MRFLTPRHLHPVRTTEDHAVVETPDREVIDFDGCSRDEVDAKLRDFEAWAS